MKIALVAGLVGALSTAALASNECSILAQAYAANPDSATVSGSDAHACLKSVPINMTNAQELIRSFFPIMEFQSTLAYLLDPQAYEPKYEYPGVDLLAGILQIQDRLNSGKYGNEWEFQIAIMKLFTSAQDTNLWWQGDATVSAVFTRNNLSLVSLSPDGVQHPKIYVYSDFALLADSTDSYGAFTPSPVTHINGKKAEHYLLQIAPLASNQDVDANYNAQLAELANVAHSGSFGLFSQSLFYPGDETTLTFANGSTNVYETLAYLQGNWSNVNTGEDFYTRFCSPYDQTTLQDEVDETFKSAPPNTTDIPQLQGYPVPLAGDASDSVQAFYVNQAGLTDVGILAISSFNPFDGALAFQQSVQDALAALQSLGVQKLIVDLQGNTGGPGGGIIVLAQDTFAQIFPTIEIFQARNIRAGPSVNDIGIAVSNRTDVDIGKGFNVSTLNEEIPGFNDIFDYHSVTATDGTLMSSWAPIYGPVEQAGDLFTTTTLFDVYTDPYNAVATGINVTGTGDRTGFQPYFQADNVFMLTDGTCAGACTVFAELMKREAGVRSIAMGGRPRNKPMQALGGSKGSESFSFYVIYELAQLPASVDPVTAVPNTTLAAWNGTSIGALLDTRYYVLERSELSNSLRFSLNGQNNLRRDDADALPLQFVYEAADCRLFYTQPMLFNMTNVWAAAANSMWNGAACVKDSTGDPSSISGGDNGASLYNSAIEPAGFNPSCNASSVAPYGNGTTTCAAAATSTTSSVSTASAAVGYTRAKRGVDVIAVRQTGGAAMAGPGLLAVVLMALGMATVLY